MIERVIYHVFSFGEYEAEGFYDAEGNLLHWWSSNDASYRDEYMNPLLNALGIGVEIGSDELQKTFEKYVEEYE